MHARRSLQEQAQHLLESEFDKGSNPRQRVIWWDDGGHLASVVEEACNKIGIDVVKAGDSPLTLREKALGGSDEPAVWYVPEARDGREWFRDVEEVGGKIERSIEELAAEVYEEANRWDIADPGLGNEERASLAEILLDELTRPTGRPTLEELRSELLTKGHGSPLEQLLRDGWRTIDREDATVAKVSKRLAEEGVPILEDTDGPEAIVDKVRRWAVAQWLVEEGLNADRLPAPFHVQDAGQRHGAKRVLERILQDDTGFQLASEYLEPFWGQPVASVDDPWELVACPVDGALEEQLWEAWFGRWDEDSYEACLEDADTRAAKLQAAYGVTDRAPGDTLPWVDAWLQARDLAELALRLDTWTDELGTVPVHKLFGDEEDGTWRIDRAVREIIVSGEPEDALPTDHPAKQRLAELRSSLAETRYIDYLEQLAEETATQIRTGELLEDLEGVRRFWTDHREEFAKGPETILFYIDALRLDLAHGLARKLRDRDLQVKSDLWAGVLPSETEFGMGALTPGDVHTFEVDLDTDGKLRAFRNRKRVSTGTRENLLENEGWSIAKGPDDGWQKPRVAYFDTEIDDIGENELDQIEQKLADRVDRLADFIARQIERGKWERAFVVTDHGFVLLPQSSTFEKIDPPDGAKDVKRRRFAGDGVTDDGVGLVLDDDTRYMGHLATPVKVLVNPLQRFRKQAISDARYYHGGALPQEFILNFLRIDRT